MWLDSLVDNDLSLDCDADWSLDYDLKNWYLIVLLWFDTQPE